MPSKFSCRQLREAGQCFESFLVVRGLDMETDRERLRTIYNRDFKISLASSKSILQS
uniref:Isoform 3 of Helicase MOV-10 n=1 Tax=Homo sapiens TaxID=9606 RepID=Q9HCE1-3